MSQVPEGFELELWVAADQPAVAPRLLRPESYRAIAMAPKRAPSPSRRKNDAWGAMAISSFSPSCRTEVAAHVIDWLNCVIRLAPTSATDTESKATLYSVRPQMMLDPAGVYFKAAGSVRLSLAG